MSQRHAAPASPLDSQLDLIEAGFLRALRQFRQFRQDYRRAQQDKGVLGSRGLTEFVLDLLRHNPSIGCSTYDMLVLAEQAGYAPPTVQTLNKRLVERRYRLGDVRFDRQRKVWLWDGTGEAQGPQAGNGKYMAPTQPEAQ